MRTVYHREGARPADLTKYTEDLKNALMPFFLHMFQQGAYRCIRNVRTTRSVAIRKRAGITFNFRLFNRNIITFIDEFVYRFARSTLNTATTRIRDSYWEFQEELKQGLIQGDPVAKIAERIFTIYNDPNRARTIAQTEQSRAVHQGQLIAAKQTGIIKKKIWLPSADACDLCLSLARKGEIPLDEPFLTGNGPYGDIQTPPAHPHCFCTYLDLVA